ncbi:acyl-CoA desaturase [Luedemannella helvata]|uniref:Acyl-CoA desaturase n=1 Tax=Luedemannella helvata TaxID=349315 RepID=A0ABP4VTS6_9ACTN
MTAAVIDPPAPDAPAGPTPKPLTTGKQPVGILIALWAFVLIPFVALVAAVPVMWGWGLNWIDVVLFAVMYFIGGHGIGAGFHRLLTHGSYKANRPLKIAMAVAGSVALEGAPTQWVADHRRHHQFSDMEGDPHSPWRYGESFWGLTKGLFYSHVGWLFHREMSNQARFAPDLVADKDIRMVDKLFVPIVIASVALPAVIGGLVTWSWAGALSAFFWASLVRIALLHHVTWSINSVCHVYGDRPFDSRDKATNFWPLAILSFGEAWHNLHHADPTCARHGVLRGQIDMNARLIWIFEKLGWATNVRWPKVDRLSAKLIEPGSATFGGKSS